ncbi:hypothetical protein GCM10027435_12790 [Haloparvum alkalitolerans]|uniref:helix-turn-helix transcriptional regulator n=1 Tax=Haloparvum alkalitolerans TaxID=1042953 RepID=UPI003CEAD6BF
MELQRNAIEEIEFLARSPVRVRVLYALRTDGPVSKRELKDELNGVRTTVQRNLNALEERGWIEYTTDGYEITSCGRIVADVLLELVERTSLAIKLRPVIRWIDIDDVDLAIEHIENADVIRADATNPYAPVDEQIDLLSRATSVRVMYPTLNRGLLSQCRRLGSADGKDLEVIVTAETVDRFRTDDRYAELFEAILEEADVFAYDGDLPFYLGVTDEAAQIGCTDADNVVRVLLELGNGDACEWAHGEFEKYRRASRAL